MKKQENTRAFSGEDVHAAKKHVAVGPDDLTYAKVQLDLARRSGDPLRIELAENGLNDLLDRFGGHSCHT